MQELALHTFSAAAECFAQHGVVDEWPGEAIEVKRDAAGGEFGGPHRNGGHKITENAFDRVKRDAPDAEEAQNVINAKSVEVTTHLRQAPLPPIKAVLLHARPIVSGKAPILALGGEGVRRRAGLHVGVKQAPAAARHQRRGDGRRWQCRP